MESPIKRTRGKFVSLACEIQLSHHSMDSRSGPEYGAGAAQTVVIAQVKNTKITKGLTLVLVDSAPKKAATIALLMTKYKQIQPSSFKFSLLQ